MELMCPYCFTLLYKHVILFSFHIYIAKSHKLSCLKRFTVYNRCHTVFYAVIPLQFIMQIHKASALCYGRNSRFYSIMYTFKHTLIC